MGIYILCRIHGDVDLIAFASIDSRALEISKQDPLVFRQNLDDGIHDRAVGSRLHLLSVAPFRSAKKTKVLS